MFKQKLMIFKLSFFFIYLVAVNCSYLPFKKKSGFDDNVCHYNYDSIDYVKPCDEEGKYCREISYLTGICDDIPSAIPDPINGECSSDAQCPDGIPCHLYRCQCPTGYVAVRISDGYSCQNTLTKDYCYDDVNSISNSAPIAKVCGEIILNEPTTTVPTYSLKRINTNYMGTVENGKFVANKKACKSGFALYFYPDKSLDVLKQGTSNPGYNMYLKCVEVNGIDVEGDKKLIKYDGNNIYNLNNLDDMSRNSLARFSSSISIDKYTMTEIDLFKKYMEKFTEAKQKECDKEEYYDEPGTCKDNEIRKLAYFYDHPRDYLLYYDEDGSDVANYLIQQAYPSYQSSGFLNIKTIILLLFMFLF